MVILKLISNLFAGLFIGYLAVTNSIAGGISNLYTGTSQNFPEQAMPASAKNDASSTEDSVLTPLPSNYEYGGPIPKILIENSNYQQAAVSTADELQKIESGEKSIAERVQNALVNVYCEYKTGDYLRVTTGTGFFIQDSGVVLTNAHVAEFLLLEKADKRIRDAKCTLRGGNPAEPLYEAALLYIPPIWILENADLISDAHPTGTGERDYALLYVTKSVNGAALPSSFPALPIDTSLLSRHTTGSEVALGGYPGEALRTDGPDAPLIPVVASSTVGELYTFGSNYADVFDLTSSPVGKEGASGGPVVDTSGNAIGLIVTKGDPMAESGQSLRALSLSYVDRTIQEETGFSLIQNTEGDVARKAAVFEEAMVPFLSQHLVSEIKK